MRTTSSPSRTPGRAAAATSPFPSHRAALLLAAPLVLAATFATARPLGAQAMHDVKLHVNPRWKECAFQLDSSLTQSAWRQFTGEAGVLTYFRPLTSAESMGRGKFEVALMQWQTNIDDTDSAWNDTFVHPDSMHWLFEGSGLKFPGIAARAGVSDRMDAGVFYTRNPNSNYGVYGAQLQRNLARDTARNWSAAARVSYTSLFGPEDVDFTVYGADLVLSRTYAVWSRRALVSPYAVASTTLTRSHENSPVVSLEDENIAGAQGTLGAEVRMSVASIGVEYTVARVSSFSLKVGVGRR